LSRIKLTKDEVLELMKTVTKILEKRVNVWKNEKTNKIKKKGGIRQGTNEIS
jgi:hypothetical protein